MDAEAWIFSDDAHEWMDAGANVVRANRSGPMRARRLVDASADVYGPTWQGGFFSFKRDSENVKRHTFYASDITEDTIVL